MTSLITKIGAFRSLLATSCAVAVGVLGASQASAVNPSVQSACMSDYFAYCSQHDPDSTGVRSCMRANSSKLSSQCVGALVAAGEAGPVKVASTTKARKSKGRNASHSRYASR